MGSFDELHAQSLADPEGFWAAAAEGVDWYKRWDKVLDDSNAPMYRWFSGGELAAHQSHGALTGSWYDLQVSRGRP